MPAEHLPTCGRIARATSCALLATLWIATGACEGSIDKGDAQEDALGDDAASAHDTSVGDADIDADSAQEDAAAGLGGAGQPDAGGTSDSGGASDGSQTGPGMDTDGAIPTEPGLVKLEARHCGTETPAYAAGTGVWLASGGEQGRTAGTPDGLTWHDRSTTTRGPTEPGHTRNLIRNMTYGGGLFVVVGGYDNAYISVSCDGVTFRDDVLSTNVDGAVPEPYASWLGDVAYRDGVFVAAGGNGIVLRSADFGLTWRSVGDFVEGHFRGATAGNGLFVLVGHSWDGESGLIRVSSSGTEWEAVQSLPGGELAHDVNRGAAFGNGQFVVVGRSRCLRSSTGRAWEDCGAPAGGISGIVFDAGVFRLSLQDGRITTSSDARSWSAATDDRAGGTYLSGNQRHVVTGNGRRGYSLDGTNWTTQNVAAELSLGYLAFGRIRLGE